MNFLKLKSQYYCILLATLAWLPDAAVFAQTTETYETETPAGTTFSEGGLMFNMSGDLRIENASGFGCCPSTRYMGTGAGNGGSSGSVGQVTLSTFGKAFQLQELDAWSANDDGTNFAVGNVTFIGTRPNGTTVSYTTDINPTNNTGTGFEHLNFTGTPLAGVNLIGLEMQLAVGLNYLAIDNFKFLSVDIPSVTINDVNTTEGNSGTKILTFTATLTNAASGAFTVSYATVNNTANTANSDYVTASGTLNFTGTNGETKMINVTLNGDNTVEPDETFFVNLTNASLANVRIFDAQGIGTIQNDDGGATLSITAANASKLEGNSGTTPFFFTINRGGSVSGTSSVNYAVTGSGGNPANGADFGGTFPSGAINFAPLETSKQIQINVSGDLTDENNEGFTVTLSSPSMGTAITGSTATGTILDDEMYLETFEDETSPATAFSENGNNFTTISPMMVFQSGSFGCCPSSFFLTATGSGNVGGINFTNSGIGGFIVQEMDVWTSSNGGNNLAVGNATFTGTRPDGTTVSHTFLITPTNDTGTGFEHKSFAGTPLANQVLRSLSVSIASPLNYIQIDNLKYGLGSQGRLSINDVSLTEGNSGSQTLTFTVMHAGTSSPFTVNYATADNSASAGSDYTNTSGSLSFTGTDGEPKTITVTVPGDATVELDENFYVNLSNVSHAGVTLVDGQGTGTITNNDAATVSINNISINEGNSGTTDFTFNATLSHAVNSAVMVDFNTSPGTATAGTDYTASNGTLTFSGTAGEIETITISVNGDTDFEAAETFNAMLSNLQANGRNVSILTSTGVATILNDDPLPVPEMEVLGNGNPVADNATMVAINNNTNYGSVCIGGTPVVKSFSIQNTGAADLVLDGMPKVVLTGHTADFNVSLQPASPIVGMLNAMFEITFTPTASGTRSVTVSIENNDSDEDPYNFVVQGIANPAESAGFDYGNNAYCQTATDPTPTIYGNSGGMFSAPAGLSINANTGVIDVSASTVGGPYTVTYTTAGPCPATATFSVSIVNCQPGATLTDALITDNGISGKADAGDRIRLTATISNAQTANYDGVQMTLNNDPRVTLVPNSFKSTPVAVDDAYTAVMNTLLTIPAGSGLLQNDFDDNIPGLSVTNFSVSSVQGGTVSVGANGSFTYNPPSGFTGNDSFTYTITDSDMQTNTGTVKIRVQ